MRDQSTPAERVKRILRNLCGRMPALLFALLLGLVFLGMAPSNLVAAVPDDAFIAGYATAVLEREFTVRAPSLQVRDGLITVAEEDLSGANREEVLRTLSGIHGVLRVVVRSADPSAPDPASTIALQPPAPDRGPGNVEPASDALPVGWLPEGHLFSPLLADPRWPHFSASYQYYPNDKNVRSVGAVSFGETVPLTGRPRR